MIQLLGRRKVSKFYLSAQETKSSPVAEQEDAGLHGPQLGLPRLQAAPISLCFLRLEGARYLYFPPLLPKGE